MVMSSGEFRTDLTADDGIEVTEELYFYSSPLLMQCCKISEHFHWIKSSIPGKKNKLKITNTDSLSN